MVSRGELERGCVIALRHADPSRCRPEPASTELVATPLSLLAVEVEADLAAARRRLRPIGAGALDGGVADVVGAGVDADVVALDRPLTSADLAVRRRAAGGRIGVADANRSSATVAAAAAAAAAAG